MSAQDVINEARDTGTKVWLLADLHLSGVNPVELTGFGDHWRDHMPKMAERWDKLISEDDLVLIPGDISWAQRATVVSPDLEWIEERPGAKLLSVGNHDRWWRTEERLEEIMPPSMKTVHERWIPVFDGVVAAVMGGTCPGDQHFGGRAARQWSDRVRETRNLLKKLRKLRTAQKPAFVILMIHYPPFNDQGVPSEMSGLIEDGDVDLCVYGHFHREHEWRCTWNGELNGVHYAFGAADARNFTPIHIATAFPGRIDLHPVPMPTGPR